MRQNTRAEWLQKKQNLPFGAAKSEPLSQLNRDGMIEESHTRDIKYDRAKGVLPGRTS